MTRPGDEHWMRRAIALAQSNVGLTGDNPSVGCVVVKDGVAVGEAATAPGGRLHAEEQALDQAGEKARDAAVYLTLEPCGERSSGAASCSQRLIEARVGRVIIACEDASVLAGGRGLHRLGDAEITVKLGFLREEATVLYAGYRPRR